MTTSFRHERIIRQAANFVAVVRAQIESDITDTEILEELERERRYLREQPRTKQYNAILKAIRLLGPSEKELSAREELCGWRPKLTTVGDD